MSEVQGRDRAKSRNKFLIEHTHWLAGLLMASPRMSDAAFALFRVAVHDGKDAVTLEVLSKAMISGSAYGEQNVYAYPTRLPACSFTVGRTRSVDTNTPQGKNTHAILRHMLGCQGVVVVVMKSGVSLNCC